MNKKIKILLYNMVLIAAVFSQAKQLEQKKNGDTRTLIQDSLFISFDSIDNSQHLNAQPDERAPIDSVFHVELTKGVDYVTNNRFKEALILFDSLEQHFPNHPAPNFYIAATYQSWMLTYRFNNFQNELYENAKLAIEKGTKLLEEDDDPWLNFYVGAAYGFKALHQFRQHNWISAYFDSRNGVNNFETALEKVPNMYDCYYGLGAFNYWRTAKSKFISFLIFWMSDNRKLGLEQMLLSIDKGRYCSEEATHGLIIAYYHNGNYSKAFNLNQMAMKVSDPSPLSTLYMNGRIMAKFEKWPEAQNSFQQVLMRLEVQPFQSISYQVECKYRIALTLIKQNQKREAFELVKKAVKQSKSWVKENELENPFESFEVIKERLVDLNDNLEKEIIQ